MNHMILPALLMVLPAITFAQTHQPAEDDWWLPSYVTRSAYSGFYGGYGGGSGFPDLADCKIVWRFVNPSEGTYDWSSVERQLNATAKKVWVRFFASDTSHCPTWLRTKYPSLRVNRYRWPDGGYDDVVGYLTGSSTVRSVGDFYEIWDPRIETEFRKLLQAFKARYGTSDRFVMCYYPHGWRWGEFSVKWVPEMVRQGFTPQEYIAWMDRTTADYADAFNGAIGKLVYTGTGDHEWIEWTGDQRSYDAWRSAINTPDGSNILSVNSLRAGCGTRDGFTEVFNRFSSRPSWGLTCTTMNGFRYSIVDEANPLIVSTTRFFGTENEDFSYMWEPVAQMNTYYYIKMSYLVALRLRMNWIFAGDYRIAPAIIDYARLTMGKRAHDSPDAWVALRQYQDCREGGDTAPDNYRNFERWLVQREVDPDGRTVPTARVVFPPAFAADNCGGAYEALRTDRDRGSHYIYFGVHDAFIHGGPVRVQVKVTYWDNFAGTWHLEYDAGAGAAYKPSAAHTNANDGAWKTVTFTLNDAAFENRQAGGMDFRIYNGGNSDIAVRFVRVIKLDAPGTLTSVVDRGVLRHDRSTHTHTTGVQSPASPTYDTRGRHLAGKHTARGVVIEAFGGKHEMRMRLERR